MKEQQNQIGGQAGRRRKRKKRRPWRRKRRMKKKEGVRWGRNKVEEMKEKDAKYSVNDVIIHYQVIMK